VLGEMALCPQFFFRSMRVKPRKIIGLRHLIWTKSGERFTINDALNPKKWKYE